MRTTRKAGANTLKSIAFIRNLFPLRMSTPLWLVFGYFEFLSLLHLLIYFHLHQIQPYIQYMRFARRCEGILSARLVFKLARDDPRIGYQVYVSAALMEYFCSKVTPILVI